MQIGINIHLESEAQLIDKSHRDWATPSWLHRGTVSAGVSIAAWCSLPHPQDSSVGYFQ